MGGRYAEGSIAIAAPIEVVWAVMLDFARYGEWNPFVERISERPPTLDVGAEFRLHLRYPDGWRVTSRERITRCEPPREADGMRVATLSYAFVGMLRDIRLVRAARTQWLSQGSDGITRYRTREDFGGLLAALMPIGQVRAGFAAHASALKRRAEAQAAREA